MQHAPLPFQAHIDLLQFFLTRRDAIVECIQGVLNAQRKPAEYQQNSSALWRPFEDCFVTMSGLTPTERVLGRELEEAYSTSAFRPRDLPGLYNGLIDPAEMMTRAFYLWRRTRWPGRNGRVRYAHTLFNLYVIRRLELLCLHLWQPGSSSAGDRLAQLQDVLDRLWKSAPADQPVLVRDARWLIQLAQSPATDDLGVYFDVAQRIAETLSAADRLEIHKAGVRMIGGHLRSQVRYYSTRKTDPLDEKGVVLNTRSSNALDFALLIHELVPLLDAYERACRDDDRRTRLELADAICQGISPDPELFLDRVELLGAYSMIEPLFVAADDSGDIAYTSLGRRHVELFEEYEARIVRVLKPLSEDCDHFRPVGGTYSPYGVLYGFSSHLMEHMALKASQADVAPEFSLEDVFAGGDSHKLEWVRGWRKLPHLTREVETLFDYPQQFAEEMFNRISDALHKAAAREHVNAGVRTGRLLVLPEDISDGDSAIALTPNHYDERRLLSDRREGRCVLSYQTTDGWVAITKGFLTEILAAGQDAKVVGLPPTAADALTLMCRNLVGAPTPPPTVRDDGAGPSSRAAE